MKAKLLTIVVLLAAVSLVITACSTPIASAAPQGQASQPPTRTLSVTGNGQVNLVPDIAYVTIGVRTSDLDAKTAVDLNNSQSEALRAALVDFGVAEEDIQTTSFNIYSYEDYNQPYTDNKPPVMYTVENSVYVKVRDLATIGDLLSTAVESGANSIYGIQFDVSDKTEANSQAREAAVAAALAQATELAGFAGVELGEILTLTTYNSYSQPYYGIGGGGGEAAAVSVPISLGQITISVDVSVTYIIE